MKHFFAFFTKQKQFEQDILNGNMEYSGYYKDSFRRFRKNKAALCCLCIIVLLIAVAVFAPVIAPYDPSYQDYSAVLAQPGTHHLLGADEYGRDILSRIIYGTRISLSIGILAQLLASVVGITLGAIAGFFGGIIDSCISRIMEIFSAFPDLIFAMAIMTFMGQGILNLYIALGLLTWVRTARMIRGAIIQLKEKEYVEACRAGGGSAFRIIVKHLIPNCLSTIIVLITLGIPNAIMYEASLSFLGLGIRPPTPSWGNMISSAQSVIGFLSVYSIMPGVAIIITVISFNIFGDGLRDALDPKLRT